MMKMKRMKHIFCVMLIACLMVSVIPAGEADAASKAYRRGTPFYNAEVFETNTSRRAEVNGLYFWYEEDTQQLFCSRTIDGKGKELGFAKIKTDSKLLKEVILTDGTWVYYAVEDYGNSRAYICRAKYDGSGFEKVVTFKDSCWAPEIFGIYNGVLYYGDSFQEGNGYRGRVYSVGLTSLTKKLRSSKIKVEYATGGGRYLYGTSKSDSGTVTLKAYDCKEKKMNKVVAFKSAEGGFINVYDSKVYYYKAEPGKDSVTIYRTTLSGTGKRVKVCTVPAVSGMKGSCIYYSVKNEGIGFTYYSYDISSGETKKITQDEYAILGYTNFNDMR